MGYFYYVLQRFHRRDLCDAKLIFWAAAKKVEEVKHLGCQGLRSSLFSWWFLTQRSYCQGNICLSTLQWSLSGPEKVSISETKTKQQITDKSHGDTAVAIWWEDIVPTTMMSPVGPRHIQVYQNNADNTNVSACVCGGTCVFWYLPLVQIDQLKLWLTLFGYCLFV